MWEEIVQPGASWSHVLKRGTALRVADTEGGANVGILLYNFELPVERLNVPDTLKAQHIARLTEGFVLYSDMGRILCSFTEDSCGWHDPLGGCSPQGRLSFLVELGKYEMGLRDLVPNVNLFSKVVVDNEGFMSLAPAGQPSEVVLRSEMNTLVILNTCAHPMGSRPAKPVKLTVTPVAAPASNDPCRISRPENQRGFELTERYFA